MEAPTEVTRTRLAFTSVQGAFRLDVDLDLPARGVTALFGPSGSGKTTCLRVVAGLARARGLVQVAGETWQDDTRGVFVPTHRRRVGYVFQEAALFPQLSVRANLDYGRRRAGRAGAFDPGAVIERLGVAPLLDRSPRELSGGERQRVSVARALLAGPRLLLMDEPLASLDAARKAEILPYLERLRDELAVPMVYVSHSLDEVARLAGHLVLLEGGRVIASGPIADVLARLDLSIAQGDEAGVVVDAAVGTHDDSDHLTRLEFEGGALWVGRVQRPPGARVRVRVLARDVSLAREPPGPSSILNVLRARIAEVRDDGPGRVRVRLVVGARDVALLARVTRRSRDQLALRPGLEVYALVKSVALIA